MENSQWFNGCIPGSYRYTNILKMCAIPHPPKWLRFKYCKIVWVHTWNLNNLFIDWKGSSFALLETNSSPLKINGWKMILSFWGPWALFSVAFTDCFWGRVTSFPFKTKSQQRVARGDDSPARWPSVIINVQSSDSLVPAWRRPTRYVRWWRFFTTKTSHSQQQTTCQPSLFPHHRSRFSTPADFLLSPYELETTGRIVSESILSKK